MKDIDKLEERLHNARHEYAIIFDFDKDGKPRNGELSIRLEKEKAQEIRLIVEELQHFSQKNDVYTKYCNISFYEINYEERLNIFLNNHFDSVESDFIREELKNYQSPDTDFDPITNPFKYSKLRKKEFLNERLDILKKQTRPTESTTPFTAVHIFKLLGIIDFLHDSKGIKYGNIVKVITLLIGKSEGSIRKEMDNRASISSRSNKVSYKRLEKWVREDIFEKNTPT